MRTMCELTRQENNVPGRKYKKAGGILNGAAQINAAIMLIKLGARSALVSHFTGMKDVKIRALSHELEIPPTKGQAPTSPIWFTKATHRAEAIIFYSITMRLLANGKQSDVTVLPAHIFIEAYQRYAKHINHDGKLDINRAWQLLESIQNKVIQPVHCTSCHGIHLHVDGDVARTANLCLWCELKQYRHCPECGKKHDLKSSQVPTTLRVCNDCRSERRQVKTSDKFVAIHNIAAK